MPFCAHFCLILPMFRDLKGQISRKLEEIQTWGFSAGYVHKQILPGHARMGLCKNYCCISIIFTLFLYVSKLAYFVDFKINLQM